VPPELLEPVPPELLEPVPPELLEPVLPELLEPVPPELLLAAVTFTVPQGTSTCSFEPQVAVTLISKEVALVFISTSQLPCGRPFQVS